MTLSSKRTRLIAASFIAATLVAAYDCSNRSAPNTHLSHTLA